MTHINPSKPKPQKEPLWKFVFFGAVVIGVLTFIFALLAMLSPDKTPGVPVSIAGFDSSYMSAGQRAGDVSEWARDVAENMKPSNERSTFADTVDNYAKDGEIDAGEYDALLRVYGLLKDKSYLDIITYSVEKIRMTDSNTTLKDTPEPASILSSSAP